MNDVLLQKETLSNKDIRELYKHCMILANSKYKEPIKVLQSRNTGYTVEDFVQESMQIIIESLSKKSFSSLQKLKSFAYKTMEFHYLKEKRKYFYTKQRGSMQCISIEEKVLPIHGDAGQNYFGEYIEDTKSHINIDALVLQNLQSKNLQVAIKHNTYAVVEANHLDKLPDKNDINVLSVNHFIEMQNDFGFRESCRYYKSKGFNMTKSIYDNINTVIISYLQNNNLIEKALVTQDKIKQKQLATNSIKSSSILEKLLQPSLMA